MPKTVIVGVSGGIAAYKSAYLVSALTKRGYDVNVIMTANACEFVSALTFETISGNAAITDTFATRENFDVAHISLAKSADMFIVAPATANVLAKIASGIADDMLSTTLLAAKCPVVFAPAMNTAMYEDTATQTNINTLKQRGYFVMDTGVGMLACRDEGAGRMKEPSEIIEYADSVFESLFDMHGINVLVSAGPTQEAIDPVRYLSNNSSGKMGYAIAQAAVDRGANVTLVSGPVALDSIDKVKIVPVVSAQSMAQAMQNHFGSADVIIMCAAVADYTTKTVSKSKIKKDDDMSLKLVRTQDILLALGESKKPNQILVGFAAETNDFDKNAQTKLKKKNLDIIALNDVSRSGEGFGSDSNNIKLFFKDGKTTDLGSDTKRNLAKAIISSIFDYKQNISR